MKKWLTMTLCMLVSAFAAHADSNIFSVDFSSGYTAGDLDGQNGWVTTSNSAIVVTNNEVSIDGSAGAHRMMFPTGTSLTAGESLEIVYDVRYSIQNVRQHGRMMSYGVQTNATEASGALSETVSGYKNLFAQELSRQSGQIRIKPDADQWWVNDGNYFEAGATNLGFNPFGYNAATMIDDGVVDSDSDVIRVTYKLTKSHVTNEFDVSVIASNTVSGYTDMHVDNGISRAGAWAGGNLYFFLDANPEAGRDYGIFVSSASMDKLDPVPLPPTTVGALGLDGSVTVTWTEMAGAPTYDVYRSTTSGGSFSLIASSVTQPYSDTTVVNGTTYYYKVVSEFSNGDSALSAESGPATPATIYADALVLSTDFGSDALGDLADAADWSAISGSGSNAFAVIDDGGANKADTASVEGDFDTSVGNAVYINRLMSNEEDDQIDGYIDVVISSSATGGADSDHVNWSVLNFGISGSTAEALGVTKSVMAMFKVLVRFENNINVMFDVAGNDADNNRLAYLSWGEAGWNPKPLEAVSKPWIGDSGAPLDLETDPIRISWTIRKTRDADTYQAWASMSNLTTGAVNDGTPTEIDFATTSAADLYSAPAAVFAMGHDPDANDGVAASTLHATVSEVSVTHASGVLPAVIDPVLTSLIGGDREVIFSWESILEATGGYTITMEDPDSQVYVLATNITETTFTDSPRWNGIANTYTLTANFDNDLAPDTSSTNFSAAPVAFLPVWSQNGNWTDGSTLSIGSAVSNSPTHFYIDNLTTPFWTEGVGGYTGPTLYGLIQSARSNTTTTASSTKINSNTGYTPWGQWPYGNGMHFVKVEDFGYDGGVTSFNAAENAVYVKLVAGSWSLGNTGGTDHGMRALIRNGTDWYASDTVNVLSAPGGQSGRTVLVPDVAAETWYPMAVNPTTRINPSTGSPLLDTSVLTNVNAIGWYGGKYFELSLNEFEVQVSGALNSYDYWAVNNGLVSSNNAAGDDPDMDGLSNDKEFAFGGNPLVYGTATLPEFNPTVISEPGTGDDVFTYVYLEQRDPVSGISYNLKTTENLVFGPWVTGAVNSDEAIIDYYWKAVTNYIPIAADTTFIKVDIE